MQALLDGPDPRTRRGVRDRAMLHVVYAGGLRVSELIGLRVADVALQPQASIHVLGKGRRERMLPLWSVTASALRSWLAIRGEPPCPELFVNQCGEPLTRSGVEHIVAKYVAIAAVKLPSLANKRVSPHVLRHTCALHTLQATRDVRKVALWLGHANVQTAEIYLRADPNEKLDAIEAVVPASLRRGRFRAPDKLIASLAPTKKCGGLCGPILTATGSLPVAVRRRGA